MRVDRDVTGEDGTVHLSDTRYFVTSIASEGVTAKQLLATARNHWQVESLFFLKDRWWDEDRHWTRRPGLSEWLARLTTTAASVLRIFRSDTKPLRALTESIQWNPCLGLSLLGFR